MNSRRGFLRMFTVSIIAVSGCSNPFSDNRQDLKNGDLAIINNDDVPHQVTIRVTEQQSQNVFTHLSLNADPGNNYHYAKFIDQSGKYMLEVSNEINTSKTVPLQYPSSDAIEVEFTDRGQMVVSQVSI